MVVLVILATIAKAPLMTTTIGDSLTSTFLVIILITDKLFLLVALKLHRMISHCSYC
jgi:hypothetical protein